MKIVFLDAKTVGDVPNLSKLESLGDVTFYPVTTTDQTAERIHEANIIITNKVVINRELMEQTPSLKLICIAATGMNNVDLEVADELGIEVKNVSGYASDSVAQATFAMILHLEQNIQFYDDYVKSGQYSESAIFTNHDRPFRQLKDKCLGIIGLGNIGRSVARIAEAFGMEVVYYSTSGKNVGQKYRRVNLDELLESSDIVSIHAPLNENTRGLIGRTELNRMKKSALLINTGRGGILKEQDLPHAIEEKIISGAALDVFENEPIEPDSPLLKLKDKSRLVMVPHIAWASVEARTELVNGVISNIQEFVNKNKVL